MSKIVTATIAPITADKLRLHNVEELTMEVPIKDPEVFSPTIVSMTPLVVTQETLDHAKEKASQILGIMGQLPATPLSGDLLALALAVLHYSACSE